MSKLSPFSLEQLRSLALDMSGKSCEVVSRTMGKLLKEGRIGKFCFLSYSKGVGISISNKNGDVTFFPEKKAKDSKKSQIYLGGDS